MYETNCKGLDKINKDGKCYQGKFKIITNEFTQFTIQSHECIQKDQQWINKQCVQLTKITNKQDCDLRSLDWLNAKCQTNLNEQNCELDNREWKDGKCILINRDEFTCNSTGLNWDKPNCIDQNKNDEQSCEKNNKTWKSNKCFFNNKQEKDCTDPNKWIPGKCTKKVGIGSVGEKCPKKWR